MAKAPATYHRSWKNLLINARYQLRYTLILVALCGLLMGGLGLLVREASRSATEVSEINLRTTIDDPAGAEAAVAELRSKDRLILYVLVGACVLSCVGLFAYGIKMTHHVAGPLFKVTTYFDKMKGGKFDTVYNLRKGDELVEFYEHFKEAHAAVKKAEHDDVARLKAAIAAADASDAAKGGEVADRLAALKTLLARKEAGLG